MPTDYALYLESGPKRRKTMVHVLDLLGCVATGPTTEEAIEATPDAIRAYLRFLKRCGEGADPGAPFITHIEEHITEGMWLGNGSPYLMYTPDYASVTEPDIETYTRRFHEMRAILADWAEQQTAETLAAGTEAGRANGAILLHAMGTPGAYVSPSLGGIPGYNRIRTAAERGELSLSDGFRQTEALVSGALRAATAEQCTAVVTRGEITRSLRKAIRRTLEHDWEHLAELSRRPGGPAI